MQSCVAMEEIYFRGLTKGLRFPDADNECLLSSADEYYRASLTRLQSEEVERKSNFTRHKIKPHRVGFRVKCCLTPEWSLCNNDKKMMQLLELKHFI